ncbi:hypothetical protein AB6A40_006407 [Gnathostoma spinigerum]|uniref:Uncharacterized protein n=1 Tax=Gnathostoma spinigerum TaxID=75299 RepID=A0ABD6EIH7_9BILA
MFFVFGFRCHQCVNLLIFEKTLFQISVQKVTTLAFSVHDGKVKSVDELNQVQKREALADVPPLLNYMSYLLHFQTVLTGPICFYSDYMDWIDGRNIYDDTKKIEVSWYAVGSKLLKCLIFGSLVVIGRDLRHPEIIASEESLQLPILKWWFLFYIVIGFQRIQYYFAWLLADAVCNISGLGFNGYDAQGVPRWGLVSNVIPYKVEMALSFKDTLDSWNISTTNWLRRISYDRTPENMRIVATYLLSALWHGFFLGYYITFLTGALFTVAARSVRRCLRHRFQGSTVSRRFYDFLTFITTKIALAYVTFPFVTMHLNPGLMIYRRLYFFMHLLSLFAIIILPVILPPEKRSSKSFTKKTEVLEEKKLE